MKAREQGILEWCRESGIPFEVYPAEVLNDVEGSFTSSAFVKETTGVDNVCERSALLASDGGKLIRKKDSGGWCDSGTGCERMEDSFCINYILLELDRETMNR